LYTTYKIKIRGPREITTGRNPIHVSVSVEPINPCVNNTPERTPSFIQPNFSGGKIGESAPNQGVATGGASSGSSSQVSTLHGVCISSLFKMAGHDPTIRLR
jgi:hypothetical protein